MVFFVSCRGDPGCVGLGEWPVLWVQNAAFQGAPQPNREVSHCSSSCLGFQDFHQASCVRMSGSWVLCGVGVPLSIARGIPACLLLCEDAWVLSLEWGRCASSIAKGALVCLFTVWGCLGLSVTWCQFPSCPLQEESLYASYVKMWGSWVLYGGSLPHVHCKRSPCMPRIMWGSLGLKCYA